LELQPIQFYSQEQIQQACEKSPAVDRYLKIIQKDDIPDYFLKRHTAWLKCALAQIFETSSTKDICLFWSLESEKIISEAWNSLLTKEQNNLAGNTDYKDQLDYF